MLPNIINIIIIVYTVQQLRHTYSQQCRRSTILSSQELYNSQRSGTEHISAARHSVYNLLLIHYGSSTLDGLDAKAARRSRRGRELGTKSPAEHLRDSPPDNPQGRADAGGSLRRLPRTWTGSPSAGLTFHGVSENSLALPGLLPPPPFPRHSSPTCKHEGKRKAPAPGQGPLGPGESLHPKAGHHPISVQAHTGRLPPPRPNPKPLREPPPRHSVQHRSADRPPRRPRRGDSPP